MRAVNNAIKNQTIALYVLMAIFYILGNVFKNAQAYIMGMIQMEVILYVQTVIIGVQTVLDLITLNAVHVNIITLT